MIQEDDTQTYNNISTSGGSRSSPSKKLKQRKVPQRGLGVAQLEKIRIEEQQKKDSSNIANYTSPSTTLSPTRSSSIPIATFSNYPCNNNQSKPSMDNITFHPPSPPSNVPSLNDFYKTQSSSSFDNFHLGSIPPMNPRANGEDFNIGWPSILTHNNGNGNGNVSHPMLSQPYEFNLDKRGDNFMLNDHNLSFSSPLCSPYENCPLAPLPDMVPRLQHYEQASSLMNGSSMSSLSFSSSLVLSFPMEPPSSQSYYNRNSPLWPDEEKIMVGVKRACPFTMDNPPIPTFNGKFAAIATHSINQSEESLSCRYGGEMFNFEPAIPVFREVRSCPNTMPELRNIKDNNGCQNDNSNKEFLSLAPPTIVTPLPKSRLKPSSTTFLAFHNREFCNFESLSYQGNFEDIKSDLGQAGSSQQPKFFRLFPTTKIQVPSASSPTRQHNCNGEVRESIDLNLRL